MHSAVCRCGLFLWLVLSGLNLGCNKSPASNNPNASSLVDPGPVQVTVAHPVRKTLKWTIEQPGTIQAFEQAPLIAKVSGYVDAVNVDIDDRVEAAQTNWMGIEIKSGTLLATIDIPEWIEEAKQKEAQVAQARVEVELAKKDQLVAEANVKSAQTMVEEMITREKQAKANYDRWKSESNRVDGLVSRGVIDRQTAEETRNQFLAAESGLDETKARINSAKAVLSESEAKRDRSQVEIAAAQAKLIAMQAEQSKLQAMIEYTQIRAPFDGIITGRFVHRGHFLQSGNKEMLFTIARIDPVRVFVEVPESAVDRIQKGGSATVRIQSLRGAAFTGTIARTSWALSAERTLKVEIDLSNPEGRIRPGMYAFASIPVELANALVIPVSALHVQDEVIYVYLKEEDKAIRYQVQLGQRDSEVVEVLQAKKAQPKDPWKQWTGKEEVILTHQGLLVDGVSVAVK